jgi:hypothetical protein
VVVVLPHAGRALDELVGGDADVAAELVHPDVAELLVECVVERGAVVLRHHFWMRRGREKISGPLVP